MMTKNTIATIITKNIHRHFPHLQIDKIEINMTLTELEIESLDFIELIFAIENELNIELDPENLNHINTLQDLVDHIHHTIDRTIA